MLTKAPLRCAEMKSIPSYSSSSRQTPKSQPKLSEQTISYVTRASHLDGVLDGADAHVGAHGGEQRHEDAVELALADRLHLLHLEHDPQRRDGRQLKVAVELHCVEY